MKKIERSKDSKALQKRESVNARYGKKDLNDWIFSLLKLTKTHTVLDLCCGRGKQTLRFADICKSGFVCAVDISKDSLNEIRKARVKNIKTKRLDMDKLSQAGFRDNSFDIIHCAYGLYYSKDAKKIIQRAYLLLKKYGTFAVVGPTGDNSKEIFDFIGDIYPVDKDIIFSSKDFMNSIVVSQMQRIFGNVRKFYFHNAVTYPDPKSLYEYIASTTFYKKSYDAAIKKKILKYFEKHNTFRVRKVAMAALAVKKSSPRFIVATIKPWNHENFYKLKKKDKENRWFLIDRKEDLIYEKVQKIRPLYIFFPHWSWIIPEEIWSQFECVVFHMTDLPYGRGGTPLQNLILRGHKKTMLSAIRVDRGIDTGYVYCKRPLSLLGKAEEIYRRKSKMMFEDIIPYVIQRSPIPVKQKGRAVLFKRRRPEQSKITDDMNLSKLNDFIRMLDAATYPHAFIETKKLKIAFSNVRRKDKKLNASAEIYEK